MGLHTLQPTPDNTGLGSKVQTLVHKLGAIKAAYDFGHTAYEVAKFVAPYARTAGTAVMQAGRAALPLLSAAL